MIPAEYRKSGFTDWGAPGWTMTDTIGALDNDEFYLDPTRITLLCGTAGYDGTQFKALLASEHDIQINKTSRNSVLVQININNTRSDLAHLIKALADMARGIEKRLAEGGEAEQAAFKARVKSLVEDVPGPARLPALPRRLPRRPEERHAGRAHARGRTTWRTTRRTASTSSSTARRSTSGWPRGRSWSRPSS